MNKPKRKGTAGETELLRALDLLGIVTHRTAAGCEWDLERDGEPGDNGMNVLATRPDNGRWLITMTLMDFTALVSVADGEYGEGRLKVEVKRYAKFAHHTIFEGKFGR
jgi:hypothetical protein